MNKIKPVILAGGIGSRLWPTSRRSYPKQFSNFFGQTSLFQEAVKRTGPKNSELFANPIIVTSSELRFTAQNQLKEIATEADIIIVEPSQKNTAPAILAAAIYAHDQDPDAILFIAPSDQIIEPANNLDLILSQTIENMPEKAIILFGADPTRPETGYGYIETSTAENKHIHKIKRFREKPVEEIARSLMNEGGAFWNTGIVLARVKTIISAFDEHADKFAIPVKASLNEAKRTFNFLELNEKHWSLCKAISFDFLIVEKAQNTFMVKLDNKWSDVGDWRAVWHNQKKTPSGVSLCINSTAIDCTNTLLRSENDQQHLVALGLDNIIAVTTYDAILVTTMDKAQEVKSVVANLQKQRLDQANSFPKIHRPWGFFERLLSGDHFQVKKLCIYSNSALSLQSHEFRSEHWIVIEGEVKATLEGEAVILKVGQSIVIPVGKIHRLENLTNDEAVLIEIQTGLYLGEDDIIRYEDEYLRN